MCFFFCKELAERQLEWGGTSCYLSHWFLNTYCMGNVSPRSLKERCLPVSYLTPLSDSMQNFSLGLEPFPVALETLAFLYSACGGAHRKQWCGRSWIQQPQCWWFTALSKRLLTVGERIPRCKLQDTEKLLYSTCFLCVCLSSSDKVPSSCFWCWASA